MYQLATSLHAKNLDLKNRLVMPPMATAKCTEQGHVTDPLLDYYREKTAGGYFSMVITEHCFVSPEGMAHDRQLSIADDSTIEGLSRLVAVIHENGSKAIAQISHAGSEAKGSGLQTCSASMVSFGKHCAADHAMTADEIHTLVQKFALAAKRAKDAGYDGIELHSAHTYLLDQFYSPLSNHRTDEYGGSISNRIRIHLEIIRAVKKQVGEDYPILLRLGALDYQEGGSTTEDAILAAKAFEKAGISILDISGGMNGYIVPGKAAEQGYYCDVTAALKKEISIPIIMTGGIKEIEFAEEIVRTGQTDLVGIGRAVLKDSNWIRNAAKKIGL